MRLQERSDARDDMHPFVFVFYRVLFMQAFVTRGIGKCGRALRIGAANARSQQVRAVQSHRALHCRSASATGCGEARGSAATHSGESPWRSFCNSPALCVTP